MKKIILEAFGGLTKEMEIDDNLPQVFYCANMNFDSIVARNSDKPVPIEEIRGRFEPDGSTDTAGRWRYKLVDIEKLFYNKLT